jgi:hypothetical protein
MTLFPLYIDPGTGSALFSIAIGIAAASFFFVRSLILKLKISFFRKKAANQPMHKYVIYAEDKRYWVFFISILDEFETRQTEVLYLTTSLDDPVFSMNFNYVKGKYIGQGNKAFAYLNFLSADIVLATTPDLDVLQWKRSKNVNHYCHIFHAVGGSTLYRLFGIDYYDTIFLSGENEVPEIRCLESIRRLPKKDLVVVGNTFLDACVKRVKQIPVEENHQFTVLVSPSWGPSALLKVFGAKLLDPLGKTGWHIIVRPHPQSAISEKLMLEALEEKYRDNPNIEWDYNHENIYALARSDVMISDFSGIIYDYIFLFDRPVLINTQDLDLRRLDAHCLKEESSYLQILKKLGMELDGSCLDSIKDAISNLLQDTELKKNRQEAKKVMWQYPCESGKRIVDFMMETVNKGAD